MNKFEIALAELEGNKVSLSSMTTEALSSFISIISSMKALSTEICYSEKLHFIIKEGSAQCDLVAAEEDLDAIYSEINLAIKGESHNKVVVMNLRSIQDQLKNKSSRFRFNYNVNKKPPIDLFNQLYYAKKISLKKDKTAPSFKLSIISGFLNQIGGKNPNYHFDYGGGNKITISCSEAEAKHIKDYLYNTVYSLLLCKESKTIDKETKYFHKVIVEKEYVVDLKKLFKEYFEETDLVKKLGLIHDFVTPLFKNSKELTILKYLLVAFDDMNFHLSEMKTILVISKPFENSDMINNERKSLLATFEKKKNSLTKQEK